MLEAFFQGAINPFAPSVFPFLMLGVILSLLLGFIPGIGGFILLPVLLTFLFVLEPTAGLVFLMGMTVAGTIGGAMSTILFNIPGDAPNAATLLDGYPMTQQGKAGQAMGAALVASGVGGMLGGFMVLPLVPIIKPIVLEVRSPETFLLVMVGIAFMAELSREGSIKGLLSGMTGLLITFVGFHAFSGVDRFVFYPELLQGGFPLIGFFLGLFAIPQVIQLSLEARGSQSAVKMIRTKITYRDVFEGGRQVWTSRWLFSRTTGIGAVIGLIPGLGAMTSIWIAYGHAKQTSPMRDRFGQGAIDGVIAPESANESKDVAAALTTLAFGIPGSVTWAIILGGFLIIGIVPGPGLLFREAELSFTLMWALIWGNGIGALIAMAAAPFVGRLGYVSPRVLVPMILSFAYLAVFIAGQEPLDYLIMAIVGSFGYALSRFGFNRPALVLGFVLGGLAELNFQRALALHGPYFAFSSVVAWGLLIIVVFMLFRTQIGAVVRFAVGRARRPQTPASAA